MKARHEARWTKRTRQRWSRALPALCLAHPIATLPIAALAIAALAIAAPAGAQGTTTGVRAPSASFVHLPDGVRALPQMGGEVARLPLSESSFVAVTSVAVPEGQSSVVSREALETLRQDIRKNVAAAVPLAKIRAEEALTPIQARTRARQAGLPLVLLAPSIRSGELFLEVTVTKWPRNFWRRALSPEGTAEAVLRVRAGAESLRHLFPAAKAVVTRRSIIKSPISAPVAIACGDIDDDGKPDLAVVGRHSIVLGSLLPEFFRESGRRTWEGLSPVHGAPLRAPLAAARIENSILTVGLSDREQTVHLDRSLELVGKSARGYPLENGRCFSYFPEGGVGREFECQPAKTAASAHQAPVLEGTQKLLEAYATSTFLHKAGIAGSVTTSLALGGSEASIELSLPSEQLVQLKLPRTGSALVSADLDGDGTVEIISSSDSVPDSPDHLRIHTVRAGKLEKRAEIETSSIYALALCPFDGENPLTLVMATAEELWILK